MPSYHVTLHPTAKRELNDLPDSTRTELRDRLTDAAERREPSAHPSAKHLTGTDGLFRIRAEDTRAICRLEKPELQVLRVGKRSEVYDIIDDIDDRLPA